MRRLLPRSLYGQMLLLLTLGLILSHVMSMVVHNRDRVAALNLLGEQVILQRMASLANLMLDLPDQWRPRIVAAQNEKRFRAWLSPQSSLVQGVESTPAIQSLAEALRSQIQAGAQRKVQLQLVTDEARPADGVWLDIWQLATRLFSGHLQHQTLRAAVQLDPDLWLNIVSQIPDEAGFWSGPTLVSLFFMSLAVLLLSAMAIRRLIGPLAQFGQAARRLGRDMESPPLDENGAIEVREVAQAFNEMQRRLRRLIENRTRMLAAISHDLRTPITLLQLRVELIEDREQRERMLAILADMEQMIRSVLDFSRQDAVQEAVSRIDLGSLIGTQCTELQDAGHRVDCPPLPRLGFSGRPIQLRRAIGNLLGNALRYAGAAEVRLDTDQGWVEIQVLDRGPGIPEEALERVVQPFYRCESSRDRSSGGVGLGLSVAQAVAHAHGGELILSNREGGGLSAVLRLPGELPDSG